MKSMGEEAGPQTWDWLPKKDPLNSCTVGAVCSMGAHLCCSRKPLQTVEPWEQCPCGSPASFRHEPHKPSLYVSRLGLWSSWFTHELQTEPNWIFSGLCPSLLGRHGRGWPSVIVWFHLQKKLEVMSVLSRYHWTFYDFTIAFLAIPREAWFQVCQAIPPLFLLPF